MPVITSVLVHSDHSVPNEVMQQFIVIDPSVWIHFIIYSTDAQPCPMCTKKTGKRHFAPGA